MKKNIVSNLLYKELSYQIHGAAIEVRKDFGPGHKEKLYQKAFEEELRRKEVPFEKEKAIKIYSPKDSKYIGLYRPDFIVDGKVIIEMKAERFVSRDEIKRIYDYLRNSEYELGYFINFASPRLFVKRIIYTNDRKPFTPPKDTNIRPNNTKKNLLVSILVSISLILVLFGGLSKAEAAQLNLISQTQEINVGQQFQVDIVLDTESEEINAIEGKVFFPEELLELKEIRDGNSIINFWIKRPSIPLIDTNINTNKHEIVFSGITPGGFNGERGLIFSVIFQAKQKGSAEIEIREVKTLLNDGKGSEAKSTAKNLLVSISDYISGPSWASPRDAEPPETFRPEIARDETLFDGRWFLVFATQDKSSGIDHYEIKESRQRILSVFRKWVSAESPYVLKDQKLRSYVYIKAVDKAGNERIAVVEPRYPTKWYENWWIWIIIILVIIFTYIFIKGNLWTKKSHE